MRTVRVPVVTMVGGILSGRASPRSISCRISRVWKESMAGENFDLFVSSTRWEKYTGRKRLTDADKYNGNGGGKIFSSIYISVGDRQRSLSEDICGKHRQVEDLVKRYRHSDSLMAFLVLLADTVIVH